MWGVVAMKDLLRELTLIGTLTLKGRCDVERGRVRK
jgi:hypothetical protein